MVVESRNTTTASPEVCLCVQGLQCIILGWKSTDNDEFYSKCIKGEFEKSVTMDQLLYCTRCYLAVRNSLCCILSHNFYDKSKIMGHKKPLKFYTFKHYTIDLIS